MKRFGETIRCHRAMPGVERMFGWGGMRPKAVKDVGSPSGKKRTHIQTTAAAIATERMVLKQCTRRAAKGQSHAKYNDAEAVAKNHHNQRWLRQRRRFRRYRTHLFWLFLAGCVRRKLDCLLSERNCCRINKSCASYCSQWLGVPIEPCVFLLLFVDGSVQHCLSS